jgi:transcriptional regulator with XRE-family HTH domain
VNSVRPSNTFSGSALRELRLHRGLSIAEVLRRTGIRSRSTIWHLETETRPVSRATRQAVAAVLLDIPLPEIDQEA